MDEIEATRVGLWAEIFGLYTWMLEIVITQFKGNITSSCHLVEGHLDPTNKFNTGASLSENPHFMYNAVQLFLSATQTKEILRSTSITAIS